MKIIFLLIFLVLTLNGCGKKSDPEHQSLIKKQVTSI